MFVGLLVACGAYSALAFVYDNCVDTHRFKVYYGFVVALATCVLPILVALMHFHPGYRSLEFAKQRRRRDRPVGEERASGTISASDVDANNGF